MRETYLHEAFVADFFPASPEGPNERVRASNAVLAHHAIKKRKILGYASVEDIINLLDALRLFKEAARKGCGQDADRGVNRGGRR